MQIVIASDYTSDIFSLATLSWRPGPPAPFEEEAGTAQYLNTFVAVGGSSNEEVLDTVYIFDEIHYEWKIFGRRLQVARQGYPGLVLVPDEFVSCT